MDLQTRQPHQNLKFTANDCQTEIILNQIDQQLILKIISNKNKNIYSTTLNDTNLPQDLKHFYQISEPYTNILTLIKPTLKKIHLTFLLAFGPQSQIKKQIILVLELKEIGRALSDNIHDLGNQLSFQMIEMNKKNQDEQKKLKDIILGVQNMSQKVVCECEELKLQSIQFKHKFQIVEQKLTALQILLKDLYIKFQVLKEEKQRLQKRFDKKILPSIIPLKCENKKLKKQRDSIFFDSQMKKQFNEQSFLKKIQALQDQRDEQRKQFQEKLTQKQEKLNEKVNDIQQQNYQQPYGQVQLLSNYLKDSQIQKLKNTVSSSSSQQKSQKSTTHKSGELSIHKSGELNINLKRISQISSTQRKIGLTGKYYCGEKLCKIENCKKCKNICRPHSGDNCEACMKLDVQRRGLKKGFLVNGNGQVAWLQSGQFSCGIGLENAAYNCGSNGKHCKWCCNLTQIYEHRYTQLLN